LSRTLIRVGLGVLIIACAAMVWGILRPSGGEVGTGSRDREPTVAQDDGGPGEEAGRPLLLERILVRKPGSQHGRDAEETEAGTVGGGSSEAGKPPAGGGEDEAADSGTEPIEGGGPTGNVGAGGEPSSSLADTRKADGGEVGGGEADGSGDSDAVLATGAGEAGTGADGPPTNTERGAESDQTGGENPDTGRQAPGATDEGDGTEDDGELGDAADEDAGSPGAGELAPDAPRPGGDGSGDAERPDGTEPQPEGAAEGAAAEPGAEVGDIGDAGPTPRAEEHDVEAVEPGGESPVTPTATRPGYGVTEKASEDQAQEEVGDPELALPTRVEEVDRLVIAPPAEAENDERWVVTGQEVARLDELPLFRDLGPPASATTQVSEVRRVQPQAPAPATGSGAGKGVPASGESTGAVIIRPVKRYEPEKFLYDSFDGSVAWGVESAEDHATLQVTKEHSSDGARSLKVGFEDGRNGGFEIRREVYLKLPERARFTVDIYNPNKAMYARMFVYASIDEWRRFETRDLRVESGWNRAVGFELNPGLLEGEARDKWVALHEDVIRIGWQFQKGGNRSGAVYIDNIRMNVDPLEAEQEPRRPIILGVEADRDRVECYDPIELKVEVIAVCKNIFDVRQLGLVGMFISPTGQKREVRGFVFDLKNDSTGRPDYRIRFAPDEEGPWYYVVRAENENGKTLSRRGEFRCVREEPKRGMVRVSKQDPRYFEFDNGEFFFPIGQNVAWAGKYEFYLDALKKQGANCVRIWLCPWHLQLEGPKNPGRYNLGHARHIDAIFKAAEARGMCVLIVVEYHGMLQGDWAKNPYNEVNGGPCAKAWDFFTNSQAKELFMRRLDYIVARWGHSSAVFAWELWNEVDLTSNWDHLVTNKKFEEIVDWHREIGAYLKAMDPYRHLVTTSTSNTNEFDEIYDLKEIDFVPKHFYTEAIVDEVVAQFEKQKAFGKPYFVGEFSGGTDPRTDQKDVAGIRLHAGLWASFMTPTAGSALPWWWDIHVQKFDLYHHFRALSAFAAGEDRRGRKLAFVSEKVQVTEHLAVDVLGLYDRLGAYLWVYNRRAAQDDIALSKLPVLPAPVEIALSGFIAGTYRVEIWDTYEGKVLHAEKRETDGRGLVISIPRQARDVAVKVRKLDRVVEPTIRFLK